VLIDANGVVSLWIDNDWTANARFLLAHDPQWCTEPYALIMLSNVFATYLRHKLLARRTRTRASNRLRRCLPPDYSPSLTDKR